MIGYKIEEGWQKWGTFQQRRTPLNVFEEGKQNDSQCNRGRSRSHSSEMMETDCEKQVKENEEQENWQPSKDGIQSQQ